MKALIIFFISAFASICLANDVKISDAEMQGLNEALQLQQEQIADLNQPVNVIVSPIEAAPQYSILIEPAKAALQTAVAEIDGVHVYEREAMGQLLEEQAFSQSMLATDSEDIQTGGFQAADAVITGTIISAGGSAAGKKGRSITTFAKVKVRVVDVRTGQQLYINTLSSSSKWKLKKKQTMSGNSVGWATGVIGDAIGKLSKDAEFKGALRKKFDNDLAGKVAVMIAATPKGAEIKIDDIYKGDSPLIVALPPEKAIKLTITKSGYSTWENKISPTDGLKLSPNLEPEAKEAKSKDSSSAE